MESCRRFVLEGGLETPSPINVIKAGFQGLTEHKEPLFGSSTACIMVLDKTSQMLHSANLGDSGFLVIRQGSVVRQSSEQQHYFNTPYQLAIPPPGQAGAVIQDSLDEAESTSFSVEPGDLIVLASDGLFDNVSTEQILKEVSQLENNDGVARERLPASSLERQRRDIENARQEIEEFIDGLEVGERRRLLIMVLNNDRGSLDYARRLLDNDDPHPSLPGPSNIGCDWCISQNCINMPTPDENKCCRRRECITSYELFQNLCIDRHVLELAIRARCDIRVEPLDFSMTSFRKAGYRQFILWEHGYLGKGNRRIIPSCAVKRIRAHYPAPDNVYMGFRAE